MNSVQFFSRLRGLTLEELNSIKGVGPILAQNVVEFIHSERFAQLETDFAQLQSQNQGFEIAEASKPVVGGALQGLTFVITGTFDRPRPEIKQLLEAQGAQVTSALSANTDVLLVGDKPGSKVAKAEKLGVTLETDLSKYLKAS